MLQVRSYIKLGCVMFKEQETRQTRDYTISSLQFIHFRVWKRQWN